MQDSRANSTLELVVNEQQARTMSQIDLNHNAPNRASANGSAGRPAPSHAPQSTTTWGRVAEWPARLRETFNAKIDEARAKSDTSAQFVIQLVRIFSGTFIWALCFLSTIILPVVLFIVGLCNLDDCQQRPSLPYLVFATGFTMTASNLFNLALTLDLPVLTKHRFLSEDIKNVIASIVNIIFNCVATFLYILCAYMVFSMSSPSSLSDAARPSDELSCATSLYYFTFWFASLTLGGAVLLCLVATSLFVYNNYRLAIIRGSTPRSQPNHSSQSNGFAPNGLKVDPQNLA